MASPDHLRVVPNTERATYSGDELQAVIDVCDGAVELRNITVAARAGGKPLQIDSKHLVEVVLDKCDFVGGLTFRQTRLDSLVISDVSCGDSDSPSDIKLTGCNVKQRVSLTTLNHAVRVREIRLTHCHLAAGANMVVASESVTLTGTAFGAPSSLSVAAAAYGASATQATLRSLAAAVIGGLRVEGFDVRRCKLRGAQGLDEARFVRCRWQGSPGLSARRIIPEEIAWRQAWPSRELWGKTLPLCAGLPERGQSPQKGVPPRRWPGIVLEDSSVDHSSKTQPPKATSATASKHSDAFVDHDGMGGRPVTAWEVEELYRALHRGAIADGNYALAADYAWGEYTMRRLAGRERVVPAQSSSIRTERRAGKADRGVVRIYRLLGGLGVRARWPLTWLVVLVLGLSYLLGTSGYSQSGDICTLQAACWTTKAAPRLTLSGYLRSVSVTSGFVVSAARPPADEVQGWVPGVLAATKLLGLGLLGSAAVALRSRVRR
jgi:hypothetical protein